LTRIGIIGSGPWAKKYYSKIENFKNINASLIYPSQVKKALDYKREAKILFEKNKLHLFDGLIIATVPKLQFYLIPLIVNYKIPTILEKPLCTNYYQYKKIKSYIEKAEYLFLVNHFHLFDNKFIEIYENFKKTKQLNKIKVFHGNFGPFKKSVDPIFDWGPHAIGAAIKFFGYNQKIRNVIFDEEKNSIDKKHNWKIELSNKDHKISEINFGNNFKNKKNLINFYNSENLNILNYDQGNINFFKKCNLKKRDTLTNEPMINIIEKLLIKIQGPKYKDESITISIQAINLILRILKKLN